MFGCINPISYTIVLCKFYDHDRACKRLAFASTEQEMIFDLLWCKAVLKKKKRRKKK